MQRSFALASAPAGVETILCAEAAMFGRNGPRSGRDGLLAELAERTGAHTGAEVAFGEPVEHDGVTVIPVARARWGFGAGTGGGRGRRGKRGEGSGGGGGMVVKPVGYIEMRDGHSRYHPVFDPASLLPVAVAAGAASLVFLARRMRSRAGAMERD